MLTLVKLPDRRAIGKARQEQDERQKAAAEVQQRREADRGRGVADGRGASGAAGADAGARRADGSVGNAAVVNGGGAAMDNSSDRDDMVPSRRSSDDRNSGNAEWEGERRGYIGYDDTVPQPKWRQEWHRFSRPSVPQLAPPPSGKPLTCVARHPLFFVDSISLV